VQTDLNILPTATGYDLVGVTTDDAVRARNRFITQFLSQAARGRGGAFMSELAAGRIKTNADVVSVFALSASQIIAAMRQKSTDTVPYRAELQSFDFVDARTLSLSLILFTNRGSITDNILVAA
jgi:hypothetical protein